MSTEQQNNGGRLKVSPEVARLIAKDADPAVRMKVAKGAVPLSAIDQVHALYLFCVYGDEKLKEVSLATLRRSSNNALREVVENPSQHPKLLDFIARVRVNDLGTLVLMRRNPAVQDATWQYVFSHCSYEVLTHFCDDSFVSSFPAHIRAAVLKNPQASDDMKNLVDATTDSDVERVSASDEEFEEEFDGTQNFSKQQMILEMGMAEKVKMAMTGDKEWRSLLVKDSNKTVSGAVLKNPRITEGEILFLAQNRSSSEDIIREILLNREWLKNYAIRLALAQHPRTPLPQALRFVATLNDKDVRVLSKSRNVSSVIVNTCRRMLAAKQNRS